MPQTLRAHRETLRRLGSVYKQLNAPFGAFGMDTLPASTKAIKSGTPADDSTYTALEGDIASLTTQRDALASQIRAALDGGRLRGRRDQRAAGEGLDQPGRGSARRGGGAGFLSRITSEGSSSRHAPGSSPSSVRPA